MLVGSFAILNPSGAGTSRHGQAILHAQAVPAARTPRPLPQRPRGGSRCPLVHVGAVFASSLDWKSPQNGEIIGSGAVLQVHDENLQSVKLLNQFMDEHYASQSGGGSMHWRRLGAPKEKVEAVFIAAGDGFVLD
ncbi:unnamed protein product [Phytophthora lilii]|uniref:Unnamed protein product n=1 Tax=Phytophthora lilii TaxID=2077276 RepID=A0A9W6THG3_9STRA|nr:unnamed protein product [Phytophthora lilii]